MIKRKRDAIRGNAFFIACPITDSKNSYSPTIIISANDWRWDGTMVMVLLIVKLRTISTPMTIQVERREFVMGNGPMDATFSADSDISNMSYF